MTTAILAGLVARGRPILLTSAAAIAALTVAACGSGSSSRAQPPATQGGSAGALVSMRTISGVGSVLVAPDGRTLYASDQEKAGKPLCVTSDCTAIWMPLLVPAGQTPMGPTQMTGALSTITRPDGAIQVALNGKPLYTFSFDHSPGDVAGNGAKDAFGGTHFTWHVATASGSAPAAKPSATPAPGGGYGY